MAQENPRPRISRMIIGFVIAFAIAISSPFLAFASTVVLAVPVLLTFLYAFAGIAPFITGAALTLGAFGVVFGLPGFGLALAAFIAPATVTVRLLRLRLPFFRLVAASIIAHVIGILLALVIAYAALGTDIIGALINYLRAFYESTALPGLIDFVAARQYGIQDAPEFTVELLKSGFLSQERRADYLALYLSDLQRAFTLLSPGLLLSSAALSGILAAAWPGYVLRHTPGHEHTFVPLGMWYTPYHLSLGMLASLGVSYLLFQLKVSGGDILYVTMEAILSLIFRVQAAASVERRMKATGAKTWTRALIIIITQLFFPGYLIYYGGASAVFGTTGAIRQLMLKRANKQ